MTFAVRILSAFCAIAVSVAVARFFGPEGSGIYSLAVVFSTVAVTGVLFGLTTATVFYVGRKEYPASRAISNNIFIALAASLPAAAGIIFAGSFLGGVFGKMEFLNLVLTASAAPAVLLFNLLSHILVGTGQIRAYNRISLVQSILLLVLILFSAGVMDLGISWVIAAYAISFLLADVLFFRAAAKESASVDWRFDLAYVKDVFRYGAKIYPAHIFSFLSTRVNFFMINAFFNPAYVGIYAVAVALSEGLLIFSKSVSTVLIARVVSEKNEKSLKEFTPLVCRSVLLAILPAVAVLAAVAPPLVVLLYSAPFSAAVPPLRILLLGVFAYCGWEILSNDLCGRGRQAIVSGISAAAFIAVIAFNVFLIPRWGISGAAWATDGAYCLMFFAVAAAYAKISGNSFLQFIFPKKSDIGLYRALLNGMIKKI